MMSFANVARRHVANGARAQATRTLRTSAAAAALAKFKMPAMSPTMTEGGIAAWKKAEGEAFAAGDVLLEIETDKATIDVEAQDDGVLAKIVAPDGSKNIQVGSTIAIVGEEGDDLSQADALAKSGDDAPEVVPHEDDAPASKAEAPKEQPKAAESPKPAAPKAVEPVGADKPSFFASPLARKIALEKGIPLGQVKGTGPDGRITKADVDAFKGAAAPAAAAAAAPAAAPAGAEYEDIPVSNMRKVIGKRLSESKREVPHYYLTVEIEVDRLLKLRQLFNKASEGKSKLSVNDFIVKAAALALGDVPEANSAWLGETIRQYKKADISVAVATPTGLITPIIKDAGGKGLSTISAETKALAGKARDGKLKPDEYQGGTFTISNLGMFGIEHFTAIINPPQSCILAVGKTSAKLVPAPEDPKGFKTVNVMNVTLSSDHRTVDGAVGARWLQAFKGYLEQPLTFML
ncbi:hypothetical protein Q8F55_003746 [Vanrija albida]|uniref:Acetyltransferase component of pyruvate dehydrogenase complex n=1 Tax=Vanrija albida TaxID=181172 RepID=A0ABR3Q4U1_9TREE